jgi:hypothetical protein
MASLPDKPRFDNSPPLTSRDDCDTRDPATIRNIIRHSLGNRRDIP